MSSYKNVSICGCRQEKSEAGASLIMEKQFNGKSFTKSEPLQFEVLASDGLGFLEPGLGSRKP